MRSSHIPAAVAACVLAAPIAAHSQTADPNGPPEGGATALRGALWIAPAQTDPAALRAAARRLAATVTPGHFAGPVAPWRPAVSSPPGRARPAAARERLEAALAAVQHGQIDARAGLEAALRQLEALDAPARVAAHAESAVPQAVAWLVRTDLLAGDLAGARRAARWLVEHAPGALPSPDRHPRAVVTLVEEVAADVATGTLAWSVRPRIAACELTVDGWFSTARPEALVSPGVHHVGARCKAAPVLWRRIEVGAGQTLRVVFDVEAEQAVAFDPRDGQWRWVDAAEPGRRTALSRRLAAAWAHPVASVALGPGGVPQVFVATDAGVRWIPLPSRPPDQAQRPPAVAPAVRRHSTPQRRRPRWPWVLAGGGAALAAGGGLLHWLANRTADEVRSTDDYRRWRAERASAIALYATGAACVVTSVVLWAVLPARDDDASREAALVPTPAGVALRWR